FFIVKASDEGMEVLEKAKLDGNCLGAPAIANGRVYVHTTSALYCFAGPGGAATKAEPRVAPTIAIGAATTLQVIPADTLMHVGEKVPFRVRSKDARGATVQDLAATDIQWSGKLPKGVKIENGMLTV